MNAKSTLVIVGGGLAGAKAAEAARARGFEGRVLIVGEEQIPPYERPPLSKAVLRGETAASSTEVHQGTYYADQGIELITGVSVLDIDLHSRRVHLADGQAIGFDALLLATGAAPRQLEIPGADLAGVHYLRTIDDAARLHEAIKSAGRVAVIGAGWIGSEVAASARLMGAEVVLIDPEIFPLHRVLGAKVGSVFLQLQSDHGVDVRLGVGALKIRGDRSAEQIILTDGRIERADVVVVGVGAQPRVELAVAAGLKVDNGILVDANLETSAPGVYAAGDVASAWHPHYKRQLRVEHWANARYQGTAAGANAVGPHEKYDRLPYFYSDQYDVSLEYVGHAERDNEVVIRGDLAGRKFIAFYHRDGVLSAALTVNIAKVFKDIKLMIASGKELDLAALADENVPLNSFSADQA